MVVLEGVAVSYERGTPVGLRTIFFWAGLLATEGVRDALRPRSAERALFVRRVRRKLLPHRSDVDHIMATQHFSLKGQGFYLTQSVFKDVLQN